LNYIKYLLILAVFLFGGLFNVGNFTRIIERESISLVEQFFINKGDLIKISKPDVSLGQVEIFVETEDAKYFIVVQVSNYWVISTIFSYFIRPKVSIQSTEQI